MPNKDVKCRCLFVVGNALCPVVEDVVVGGDLWFGEVALGYGPLEDWRELRQDALAGAAGVELVGREYSVDFEWFEHVFSPRLGH
jgi:hypothetical protein